MKLTTRDSWLCACLTLCNGTHLNCRDCGKDRPENMIVVAHLRRIDGGLQPVYGVAGVMRDVPRFLTALMPGNKEGNG